LPAFSRTVRTCAAWTLRAAITTVTCPVTWGSAARTMSISITAWTAAKSREGSLCRVQRWKCLRAADLIVEHTWGRHLAAASRKRAWPGEHLALLGKLPDAEVAARSGRSAKAVKAKRCRLGIPTFCDRRRGNR
jgi:hypothetical protein